MPEKIQEFAKTEFAQNQVGQFIDKEKLPVLSQKEYCDWGIFCSLTSWARMGIEVVFL